MPNPLKDWLFNQELMWTERPFQWQGTLETLGGFLQISSGYEPRTLKAWYNLLILDPKIAHFNLVGGFNPSEKYESQLGLLCPISGNSQKSCSKPPTSNDFGMGQKPGFRRYTQIAGTNSLISKLTTGQCHQLLPHRDNLLKNFI